VAQVCRGSEELRILLHNLEEVLDMAEQKNNPAAIIVLVVIILVALFFIIRAAMPNRLPPPPAEDMTMPLPPDGPVEEPPAVPF